MDNWVTEKKTVAMTSANNSTTASMVNISASQPGNPRLVSLPGMGKTAIVITLASKIGLMIDAVSRIPNITTNMLARATR